MDYKKYYYLKLKENYFERDNVKILESMENGYIYSNIIMKLYLKSLKYNGKLMMTDRIPYDPSKIQILSNVLNHDIAHVKEAINNAVKLDIIEILDTGEMFMIDIQNFIGLSSNEADRKREYRVMIEDKKTNVQTDVGENSDKTTPELELDIKLELNLDIDNIKITRKQYDVLLEKYSKDNVIKILNKLSSYKLAHGKKYKSDYGAINQWVVESLKLDKIEHKDDWSINNAK
jgi:predicted phage replisome organizer